MFGTPTSLIWLTLGAFAIGTEDFMIAGLLPALARDLDVGLAPGGHLVTAFSLTYAVGAPIMAVLTAKLERRRLLAIAMAGFTLANLLAALAPDYAALLAARLMLALSAASFMPAASGDAGGPERRGRTLSRLRDPPRGACRPRFRRSSTARCRAQGRCPRRTPTRRWRQTSPDS